MRDIPFGKAIKIHPLAWLWEPLEGDPSFMLRPMFGGKAAYLDGKLMLFFPSGGDPAWRGMCVCTGYEHHGSLMADFPALAPHSVLPKWLFLPEEHERFESVAEKIVEIAGRRDSRLGVIGKPRNRAGKEKRVPGRGAPGCRARRGRAP
ncbi:hypothetical protein M2103_002529 [Ereboglobus sp. PH5-5]|uniref:hypothetical protein n=1 Tax=unclassified Ereboglobus TaxID=2626932 RepID=UPI0024076279|nr:MULTISPECIES: hypothetical protein [unclassified Ereboglobus]MDF9828419.1 hypothetical protein [Ereboglobus sp. PH5-10]MDF9834284.1 hypothetical protein [Ereboglobus sp. PH5-5]